MENIFLLESRGWCSSLYVQKWRRIFSWTLTMKLYTSHISLRQWNNLGNQGHIVWQNYMSLIVGSSNKVEHLESLGSCLTLPNDRDRPEYSLYHFLWEPLWIPTFFMKSLVWAYEFNSLQYPNLSMWYCCTRVQQWYCAGGANLRGSSENGGYLSNNFELDFTSAPNLSQV